jgi:predicted esterase
MLALAVIMTLAALQDAEPSAEDLRAGGDGGDKFHPFVKNIARNALADGYVVAQLVSVEWSAGQKIVWPTEKSPAEQMKFTTEEFAEAVIEEVAKKRKLNAARVYTLSWSSGGPAAYALSLRPKRLVKGSFVAMSVFYPAMLPPLAQAKGHAYFLYHSEGDETCRFRLAEDAQKKLGEAGAKVELKRYEGGHGWTGDVYGDIREGVRWLEKNAKGK